MLCFGDPVLSWPEPNLKLFYTCSQAVNQPSLAHLRDLICPSQTTWISFSRLTGLQLTLDGGASGLPTLFSWQAQPSWPWQLEELTPKIQGALSVFHDPQTQGLLVDLTLWPCPWHLEPQDWPGPISQGSINDTLFLTGISENWEVAQGFLSLELIRS